MALIGRDNSSGRFTPSHGLSKTREFNIWANMIDRCNNPQSNNYKNYGRKGVIVCKEWIECFDNFIEDMGFRPTAHHSIDRIDVTGNYEPSNCKWSTKKEQSRNRRNSRYIYIDGKKLQVDDYCEMYNLPKHAIKNRVRRGWSNDRIINTKVGK